MLEPIQRASVFLSLSLRSETLINSSNMFTPSLDPAKISVGSSACWLILTDFILANRDAFIFILFLIALVNN